jgi:hypothetical protein
MDDRQLKREAAAFFDAFVEAFRSFDGAEIARRYVTPYLARHGDGSTDCFGAQADVVSYFQRVVSAYYANGCRACRYSDLEVAALGRECALGTVTWDLLNEAQDVLVSWRESYNLCRVDGELKVFASVDHVL